MGWLNSVKKGWVRPGSAVKLVISSNCFAAEGIPDRGWFRTPDEIDAAAPDRRPMGSLGNRLPVGSCFRRCNVLTGPLSRRVDNPSAWARASSVGAVPTWPTRRCRTLPHREGLPPDLLRKLPRPAPTPRPRTPASPRNPRSPAHRPTSSAAKQSSYSFRIQPPLTVLTHKVRSTVVLSNVNCPKAAPLTCPAAPDPCESTPRFRPGDDGTPRRCSRRPSPPP